MDYKKHIKELEVYFYFDAHTIPEIVEWYYSCEGRWQLPSNITKKEAIFALMDWLYDNAGRWYFANIAESVDYLKEDVPERHLEEALDMKKAHDLLEDMYEELIA